MAYSKVSVSNMALALLGAASIRDFSENNKRARMCDVLFEPTRDLLLEKHDWAFARTYEELNPLDLTGENVPYGKYGFALPHDCINPLDIWPKGSRDNWEVMGDILFCEQDKVGLFYTAQITNPAKFSHSFANLLSEALAIRICPSITQDKQLTREMTELLKMTTVEAWEADANKGNDYRAYDEHPENDSFVNPDIMPTSGIPTVIT